jgi:hypothetical protein
MAACGVSIVYDGQTVTAPNCSINGRPDLANVVGWQVPRTGFHGVTHFWTDVAQNGDWLSSTRIFGSVPTTVTTPEILASLITQNGDSAIGLGHTPVAATRDVRSLRFCLHGPR